MNDVKSTVYVAVPGGVVELSGNQALAVDTNIVDDLKQEFGNAIVSDWVEYSKFKFELDIKMYEIISKYKNIGFNSLIFFA